MFASGTSARTHTRDRSAIVSSVVDGSTEVPTVTPRFTTTPLLGATTVNRRFGSPVCSIASISAGVIPRTVRRVRPPATTDARDARGRRRLPDGQVLGLGREEFLGEDAGERLTRANHLARGVDVELFDPSRHPRMHVRDPRFVRHDGGDGAHLLRQRFASDHFEADAELLKRRRGDVDRRRGRAWIRCQWSRRQSASSSRSSRLSRVARTATPRGRAAPTGRR